MANDNYQQPSMFSDDEVSGLAAEPQQPYGKGTVTVLGMTFPDDEERRRYFREELRKRLPELRKIEGFPIGSDDDIIALSDPPYYTACPNPWLNDFIREWEQEKQQLEAEGKRSADFEVTEPYSADVSEGKNNPVYTAHTYHTKVPHPAVMRYLLHYTQPGDIVLDGFAGTGMTGVAAAACSRSYDEIAGRISGEWQKAFGHAPRWGARHAIIGDLSPYATNIAYFYNTPVDTQALQAEVTRIQKEMEDECGWMYTTTDSYGRPTGRISFVVWSDIMICPNCGKEYVFWHQAVDHKHKCMRDEFHCPHCHALQTKRSANTAIETYFDEALQKPMKRVRQVPVIVVAKSGKEKIQRAPNEYDLKVLERIDNETISDWFPTDALPVGYNTEQPKKTRHIFHVHQFYTKRNLIALSKLYQKIDVSPMAHALRFMFTGMINRSTNMNRVHVNNYFNGGGGWNGGYLKGTLYVPNAPTETSVLEQIGDKLGAMLRAETLLARVRPNAQYVGSADNLTLYDNSVDYVFTDPPFGANINYSELNSLPEPWLRVVTNNAHEAIENTAQGKDAQCYRDTMTRCFAEYLRVLKPGRWMTVEFSNTSAAVWNSIQNALQGVGFVVASVSALDKKQGSFKAVTTTTAVKQDLIISCFKPTAEMIARFEQSGDATENAWAFIEMVLNHLDPTVVRNGELQIMPERTPRILYDKLLAHYVAHGFAVPMNSQEFQKELHARFIERDGMYFTPDDALKYEEQKKTTPIGAEISLFVGNEREGIDWLRRTLIKPQTYAELVPQWMSMLQKPKKGDQIPELMQILQENFIKEDSGKWVIPDAENQAHKTEMRNKRLRKQFDLFVEQAQRARRLTDTNIEALRFGFDECYKQKDFATILKVAEKLPESLLMEDEKLLMYYDIAVSHV